MVVIKDKPTYDISDPVQRKARIAAKNAELDLFDEVVAQFEKDGTGQLTRKQVANARSIREGFRQIETGGRLSRQRSSFRL